MSQEPVWQTREGERIPVKDLNDSHIANILRIMERRPKWRPSSRSVIGLEYDMRRAGMPEDPILAYLWRCWARDRWKVDPMIQGWRTTAQAAASQAVSFREAFRRLQQLERYGLVDRRIGVDHGHVWFAADTPEFRSWKVRLTMAEGR